MTLERGQVHLWLVDLDGAATGGPELERLLSTAEAETAARLRRELSRERYVARRGSLRRLLAEYLGTPPEEISIEPDRRGRPHLGAEARRTGIDFNVSSADRLCLYAVARGARVGVDLERMREDVDFASVARRAFGAAEGERLAVLPPGPRREEFFARWVMAEAALKLTGEGIGGLERPGRRDRESCVVRVPAPPGYVAALATERPIRGGRAIAAALTLEPPLDAPAGPVVLRLAASARAP